MKDVLELIIKNLVNDKESVVIEETVSNNDVVYEIKVDSSDMGKIIGKQGKIARAVRTLMKSLATKENKRVTINIID